MKGILKAAVLFVAIGFVLHIYNQRNLGAEEKKKEFETLERSVNAAVVQMVERTNAITDWKKNLNKGERIRIEPILTVELERVWLQNRPVLFVGSIKDIATYDDSRYQITIEENIYSGFSYYHLTDLQLSLLAKKEYIDSFLTKHPNLFKGYGHQNGVAVVAQINSIKTTTYQEDDLIVEVKLGGGELVEIMHTSSFSLTSIH